MTAPTLNRNSATYKRARATRLATAIALAEPCADAADPSTGP